MKVSPGRPLKNFRAFEIQRRYIMAMLTSSSRRFTRNHNYSHQERRLKVDRVHRRIELVTPGTRNGTRSPKV